MTTPHRRQRLIDAVTRGDVIVTQILIQKGVNITDYYDSETPLHTACRLGHAGLSQILIRNGADVNIPTQYRHELPIYLASQRGHYDVVEVLIQAGALNEDGQCSALTGAARYGQYHVVELLMKKGVSSNLELFDRRSPLTVAARNGHYRTLKVLLQNGADVNLADSRGCYPLCEGVIYHKTESVKTLLAANADPNAFITEMKCSAIHIASHDGCLEAVDLLCAANCDINSQTPEEGKSPLYIASEMGHIEVIQQLVSFGANPNLDTHVGDTPLFAAFSTSISSLYLCPQKDPCSIIKALIQAGADVDHQNKSSLRPIVAAIENRFFDVAQLLLQAECEVQVYTPLQAEEICTLNQKEEYMKYSSFMKAFQQEAQGPRSLLRLCRVWFRKHLACNLWPYAVKVTSLPIPKPIKEYLLYRNLIL